MLSAQQILFRRQVALFFTERAEDFREHVVETVTGLLEMYLYYINWVNPVGRLRYSVDYPMLASVSRATIAERWVNLYNLLPKLTDDLAGSDYPVQVGDLPQSTYRRFVRCRALVRDLFFISNQIRDDLEETFQALYGPEESEQEEEEEEEEDEDGSGETPTFN